MISSDTISLLFRANGDTADAKKAFDSLQTSVEKDFKAIEKSVESTEKTIKDLESTLIETRTKLAATMNADDIKKYSNEISDLTGKLNLAKSQSVDSNTALTNSNTATGSSFAALAGTGVGIALVAITAVAAAAVTASVAMFNLAKSSAEFGSEIFDMSEKTGIGAEAISAIKFAADQAGISLDTVGNGIEKFSKLVSENTDKSKEKLTRLGIDPKAALEDLDGALAKVFERIVSLPPGIQQMTAAQDAFGKSGADLIPFINSFDGDLNGLIQTAKKYGVTISEDGAKASDEFGDSLDTVNAQLKGVAFQFAVQFMPVLTSGFKFLTKLLSDNKDSFKDWGRFIGVTLIQIKQGFQIWSNYLSTGWRAGVIEALSGIATFLNKYILAPLSAVGPAIGLDFAKRREMAEKEFDDAQKRAEQDAANRKMGKDLNLDGGDNGGNQDYVYDATGAETAKKKIEETRKRNRQATIEQNQLDEKIADENYKTQSEKLKESLKNKQLTLAQFTEQLRAEFTTYQSEIDLIYAKRAGLESKGKNNAETSSLINKLTFEQSKKIGDATKDLEKLLTDSEKTLTEEKKKETDKRVKLSEETARREITFERNSVETRLKILDLDFNKRSENIGKERQYINAVADLKLKLIDYEISKLHEVELTDENRLKINGELSALEEKRKQQLTDNAATALAMNEKETAAFEKLQTTKAEAEKKYKSLQDKSDIEAYERAIKNGQDVLQNLKNLSEFEQISAQYSLDAEIAQQELDKETYIKSVEGAENAAELIEAIDELFKSKKLIAEEEFQQKLAEIKAKYNPQIQQAETENDTGTGVFSGVIDGLGFSVDKMLEKVNPLKTIGNIIGSQFQAIAQGVGNAVKAFVLFGSAGGSFKKFAAEVIASIAQMAIVQAVWEFAQGAAMLALSYFTGNPKYAASATAHFTAGGIYAAIGGVAAIAGRGVAGDAFKKETTGAYGSSTSTATGQTGSGSQGGAYSGQGEQVIDRSRNSPFSRQEVHLHIKDKSGMFTQLFEYEIDHNTKTRRTIQELANA